VFTGCARDRACATAFPDLQRRAFDIVDTLNASPLVVSVPDPATGAPVPQLVDGQGFLEGGFAAMYESEIIPYLPLAVAQVSAGNYAIVEGFAANLNNPPIRGMWYSVMCHDEAPFNDPEAVAASQAAHPRYAEFSQFEAVQAVCALWGAGEAGPIEDEPVRSDVPTLLLHGAYDPIHPPAWGQIAASTLSNSTFILLPASGHGGGLGVCGQALAAEFIAQPGVPPVNECARGPGPAWVTEAYINPGVYRLASGLLLQLDWARALPFALCGVMFVSALLLWPVDLVRSFWRRPGRGEWLGRWLAALAAALYLSFAVLLLIVINDTANTQYYLLLFGLPPENAPLFIVPWVAGALSLGLAVLAYFAWRDRYWSLAGRIYFTLVTTAALGFFWLLLDWGLVRF
jgi:pimeloyl-ACP methyl ester carboxylesterase